MTGTCLRISVHEVLSLGTPGVIKLLLDSFLAFLLVAHDAHQHESAPIDMPQKLHLSRMPN